MRKLLIPMTAIALLMAYNQGVFAGRDKDCEGECGGYPDPDPDPQPEPEPEPSPEPSPEPERGDRGGDMPHGLDGRPKLGDYLADDLCKLLGIFCD